MVVNSSMPGVSSAIARTIQERSEIPILHLGIGTWLAYVSPPPYVIGERAADGIGLNSVPDTRPPQSCLTRGPVGELLYRAFHQIAASLSVVGFPVIVTHVMDDPWIIEDLRKRIAGLPVAFVGLRTPQAKLAESDHQGPYSTRTVHFSLELVRWWNERVHGVTSYDLELDMGRLDPEEAAGQVIVLIEKGRGRREAGDRKPPVVAPHISFGQIIALNGPTSAGKSSTAQAIQVLSNEVYLQVGGDLMINSLLPRSYFIGRSRSEDGWSVREVPGSTPLENEVRWGPVAVDSFHALHQAVADLSRMGCNVVMDHGLLDERVARDFTSSLSGQPVFIAGLHAPLDLILQRRTGRTSFSADPEFVAMYRWWHRHAHDYIDTYDIELDSGQQTPVDCARAILDQLAEEREKATD